MLGSTCDARAVPLAWTINVRPLDLERVK